MNDRTNNKIKAIIDRMKSEKELETNCDEWPESFCKYSSLYRERYYGGIS